MVLALVHTPVVRRWVVAAALMQLESRFGIEGRVERIDYNLLSLTARIDGLQLAALARQEPFFEADQVRLDLPWSAVMAKLAVDSLEVTRPRFSVVQAADGTSNLPAVESTAPASDPPGALSMPIRRMTVRDLELSFVDRQRDRSLLARGITVALQPAESGASGSLTVTEPVRIEWGGRESRIDRLGGGLSFDGQGFGLDEVTVSAPEGSATISGRIESLFSEPSGALDFVGNVDVGRSVQWIAADAGAAGAMTLSGRAEGPLGGLTVAASLSAEDLSWRSFESISLGAALIISAFGAEVESLTLGMGPGVLEASGRLDFADGTSDNRATVEVRDLDIAALLDGFEVETPIPLQSLLRGRVNTTWTNAGPATIDLTLEAQTRPAADGAASALSGDVGLEIGSGQWELTLDQRVGDAINLSARAEGTLSSEDLAQSSLTGQLGIDAENLPRAWRLFEADRQVERADLVGGAARADLTLSGTFDAPRLAGTIVARSMQYGAVGPVDLDVALDADRKQARIDTLDARLGPNRLQADGRVNLTNRDVEGRIRANVDDISVLGLTLPPQWRPTGSMAVTTTVEGQWPSLVVHGEVEASNVWAAGQTFEQVAARARLDRGVVVVERLEGTQADGQFRLSGRYEPATGEYSGEVSGQNLSVRPVAARDVAQPSLPLTAALDFELSGSGSLTDARGEGQITLSDVAWNDRPLGRVVTELELADEALVLNTSVPDLMTTVRATMNVNAGTYDVAAEVSGVDPGRLVGSLDAERADLVTGSLELSMHATGTFGQPSTSRVVVDLLGLEARLGDAPVRLGAPSRVLYTGDAIAVDEVELAVGGTRLSITGGLDATGSDQLDASLVGELGDVMRLVSLVQGGSRPEDAPIELGGVLSASVSASGAVSRPVVVAEAQVDEGTVTAEGLPPATQVAARAVLRGGVVTLERLEGLWQNATATASGSFPMALAADYLPDSLTAAVASDTPSPARATARIESITPQALSPFLGADTTSDMEGELGIAIELEADALDLAVTRGSLTLDPGSLIVSGVPFTQRRPTRIVLAGGRADIDAWEWGTPDSSLSLSGGMRVDGDRDLDIIAAGNLDLRVLSAFLGQLGSTGGHANLNARMHGSLSSPEVTGSVTLADAELRVTNPRLAVTELNGAIALNRDRLVTENVAGIANGGSVTIDGEVHYPGLQIVDGAVSIVGRNIALNVPPGLRSEVNTDLTLEIDSDAMTLGGTVTVLRGSYREPLILSDDLLAAAQSRFVTATFLDDRSALDDLQLAVRLRTLEDIGVDNNYTSLELGADLQLVGTLGRPSVLGRATVGEGGEIFLAGNVYEIESGTVDFINATQIEPDLSVSARTQVSGYDITLGLSGTPAAFDAQLSATPPVDRPSDGPVGEADIVSLLLTGHTLDEAGAAAGAIARDQALGLVSGEIVGLAGRAVGLDTVRIDRDARFDTSLVATETDPGARLTFGKNVRRDVQLIFSQSLRDSGSLTWIVDYSPTRDLKVRGVVLDDNTRLYEFGHTISFSRTTASATQNTSPAARESERERLIGDIRFTGTPRFTEAELGSHVDLSIGDRFNFYRWQRDEDRLEAFFHDNRYRQVRIDAMRTDGDDDAVVLEFNIDSGPSTALTVVGFELPGDVQRAMNRAWERSVFDEFLLEELHTLAVTHLAERGYLRARVETDVRQSSANEKEVVVHIDAGPRSTSRHVEFRGNETIEDDVLAEHVSNLELDATAWIDPPQLADGLRSVYRSQGMLTARVTVEESIFDGDTARLPVVIVEGRQFTVSDVTVVGAQARSETDVRDALALFPGSIYTDAAAQAAGLRVDASYRTSGFNAADVTIQATADEAVGTVAVSVLIDEGPRQILDSVAVTGADRTHTSVIEKALQLTPGEPVNREAWARARRRLYDSGVFRSVTIDAEPSVEAAAVTSTNVEPVRAHVRLEEWPAYRLRYGVQLADENAPVSEASARTLRPGFAGDLTRANLLGRAATVGASVRYNARRRTVRGFLNMPSLFRVPLTTTLFVSRGREDLGGEDVTPFVSDQLNFTVEQRWRPHPALAVTYGYNFQRNHTFERDLDPTDPFAFDLTVDIARFNTTSVVDTRNDLIDATSGWFHSSSFEYAPEAFGSDLRFVKYLAQQYYYRTLPLGIVLASAARFGLARGFEQELIPSERFFAGGGNSVRGYREDSLGPTDFFGVAVGGEALLILNQEARFPVFRMVRGVAFFDAGNAFSSPRDISLKDLRMGVGLGIRVDTPFMLLRADYGARIRRASREPFGRWFFSIGHAF